MRRLIAPTLMLALLLSADSFAATKKRKKKVIQKAKQTREYRKPRVARSRKAPRKAQTQVEEE